MSTPALITLFHPPSLPLSISRPPSTAEAAAAAAAAD